MSLLKWCSQYTNSSPRCSLLQSLADLTEYSYFDQEESSLNQESVCAKNGTCVIPDDFHAAVKQGCKRLQNLDPYVVSDVNLVSLLNDTGRLFSSEF